MKKRQFFAQNFIVMSKIQQMIEILGQNYDEWERMYMLRCRTLFVVMKIGFKFKRKIRQFGDIDLKQKNFLRYSLCFRANMTYESKQDESK